MRTLVLMLCSLVAILLGGFAFLFVAIGEARSAFILLVASLPAFIAALLLVGKE